MVIELSVNTEVVHVPHLIATMTAS